MSRISFTLTPDTIGALGGAARPRRLSMRGAFQAAFAVLWTWSFRARTRHQLARLDRHLLADIGLDPMTAAAEADKPFWQA